MSGQRSDELERMDAILRKVPQVTPPETLHDRIMASVSLPAPHTASRPGFNWFGQKTPFVALRYGMAAAAGLLVAAMFYESRGISGPVDLTELYGTMAPKQERGLTDVVDSYAFRAAGVDCRLSLERRNGMLLLDIRVDAQAPVDISVDLASAGVRLEALAQIKDPLESIETNGRVLRMQARGRRQLTALLQPVEESGQAGEAMNLEFSVKGRLLQRATLTPAW